MIHFKRALFTIGLVLAPIAHAAPPVAASAPVAAAAPQIAMPAPVAGIGQPTADAIGIQEQVTPIGHQALWMHDAILIPMITIISLFVLGLLFWASFRYRRAANPVASKMSHNTMIEIVWTLVPVLILVFVAVPSISLLSAQYRPAPANALTIKAIGNQWYWSYEYPDNGGFELTANGLPDAEAKKRGEPRLLAVDNRLVIPVNVPIRLLTTSNDVIHAWALPAFWTQMDAVPGRTNETTFTVEKTGVYYGQCNQICGARHGFMPIAVQVVSKDDFAKWVASKGGTMPGVKPAAAPPAATTMISPAPAAATKG